MTPRDVCGGIALAVPLLCLVATIASPQDRADRRGGDGGTPAVARPASPAPAPAPAPTPAGPSSTGRGVRGDSGGTGGNTSQPGDTGATRRRDRGNDPVVGVAVPRQGAPARPGGGTVILVPGGFYPWGYGGLGFGGFYGGYYDPWYDPYGYGGGYPASYSSRSDDDGAVRIKVKPRDASVYADGYYVGHVDDFDGALQKLHLSPGPHRIEVRQPNYETLAFDVRIDTNQTITYRGEMHKLP